jgi:hypothetical protein
MRSTLADLVVDAGLLDETTLRHARQHARRSGVALCRALVEQRYVADERLAQELARRLSLPRVDLRRERADDEALREVPFVLAESHCLVPLSVERQGERRQLRVAMADPLDLDAVEELELTTGCELVLLVGTVSELTEASTRAYRGIITKTIPRRLAFGADLDLGTQPAARAGIEELAGRFEALVDALVEKGAIDRETFEGHCRRVLGAREVDHEKQKR